MRLDKGVLIWVLAVARQAELSLDSVLAGKWSDLREFYAGHRLQILDLMVDALHRMTVASPKTKSADSSRELSRARIAGILSWPLKSVALRPGQISLLAKVLKQTANLIRNPQRPTQEAIIKNRMILTEAELLVECLLFKSGDVGRAKAVEHFQNPDFVAHVPLNELINISKLDIYLDDEKGALKGNT